MSERQWAVRVTTEYSDAGRVHMASDEQDARDWAAERNALGGRRALEVVYRDLPEWTVAE